VAFYIEMDKLADTDEYVEYSFGRGHDLGVLRLDKKSQSISIVTACPLDVDGKWSQRAAMKLAKLWKEGVLPDRTQWAS
jgi:hypothetical protein